MTETAKDFDYERLLLADSILDDWHSAIEPIAELSLPRTWSACDLSAWIETLPDTAKRDSSWDWIATNFETRRCVLIDESSRAVMAALADSGAIRQEEPGTYRAGIVTFTRVLRENARRRRVSRRSSHGIPPLHSCRSELSHCSA